MTMIEVFNTATGLRDLDAASVAELGSPDLNSPNNVVGYASLPDAWPVATELLAHRV